jgi:hypothetical protein
MTERADVVIRLGPLGRAASTRPDPDGRAPRTNGDRQGEDAT